MTRKEFFWCLDHCEGEICLALDEGLSIDYWSCFYVSLMCYADEVPTRNSRDRVIAVWGDGKKKIKFEVKAYRGVVSRTSPKNPECRERANAGLKKYQAWLDGWESNRLEDWEKAMFVKSVSKARVQREELLTGQVVFYKKHPFGGYDVHLDVDKPKVGYVFKSRSTSGSATTWCAKDLKGRKFDYWDTRPLAVIELLRQSGLDKKE